MPKAAFRLRMPENRTNSVIFASPHSSRDYPQRFLQQSILDNHAIRSSEDAYVDRLFAAVPDFGSPFIEATAPRAYVDMNRSPDELDPALIQGMRSVTYNPRIVSGLGVVPRVVANSRCIYSGKLTMEDVQARIDTYWHPYHARLQALLSESHMLFGRAILIDCHSMPREALDNLARSNACRPDVVLGDRFGAAANAAVMDMIERAFLDEGLSVVRNVPFAGAYTTQHYGRPSRRQYAVQVEIDRSLYMDERLIQPNRDFHAMQKALTRIVAKITAYDEGQQQLAAE